MQTSEQRALAHVYEEFSEATEYLNILPNTEDQESTTFLFYISRLFITEFNALAPLHFG